MLLNKRYHYVYFSAFKFHKQLWDVTSEGVNQKWQYGLLGGILLLLKGLTEPGSNDIIYT